ncbi:uncharacterized protein IL334_001213 [Kwoniella shivajii]|uniref:Uncharacterized protein n=1 Tax=Kwoniella shivajii TaxID=564305 RepID=A0ABZ1CRB1_9TREE|nr:hypothetical protein IL334_001213 [Kwoniella shivajii]
MDGKLREANRAITDWYNYWDGYYARNGVPKDHFLRETHERRQWLQEAGRKAQQLVNICLRGQQYANSIQYDYNIVYAARFLIRMATLVPESCNLRQIGKDVEQVAVMLAKARHDQVLPPASRAPSRLPSPTRGHVALPVSDQTSWSSGLTPNTNYSIPDLSVTVPDQGLSSHMDFLPMIAEDTGRPSWW